ncbi:FACT complex subunit SSRP1-like [Acanthaster planci]|uniref:FACT complex subunit SSRP1 n=1 Tax=Acanthaster planci TaxID=133434 RepID=A0A8B7ZAY0_ACAPL|nr:FACT complex subunit SSRP1-like [Acanthaster planci]
MTDALEFTDIWQEVRGAMNGGRLKLSRQGVYFKSNKTGKVEQVQVEDLAETNWLRVAKGYELKLRLQNGTIFKYDGFQESDQEKLTEFIRNNYNLSLDEVELAVKGRNWGSAKFNGTELAFEVDKKPAFHIPLGNVSHSTTAKNEVILEFHQNDDTEVSLMEMRFYVPPTESDVNAAEAFHEKILAKADIIQATGESIASLEQIPCLTPRGRYDIKIFPTFLQLHGKTFDYKIPFTTVLRLFLLPHKDNRQMYFVISLDPPIVQGQTRYHFLILSFNKEDDMSLDLNLTEEEIEEKYKGKLQKHMTGPSFEIVSRLMKSLSARKITIPGSFTGRSGAQTVSCSYRSNSGFLYPLERGFIYVHKPPIHIRFEEIACVNFARGTGSSRYFDFEIETRNGNVYVFSSIEKDEYSPLFDFVSNKKLRVKNRGGNIKDGKSVNYEDMVDSDDDEDTHDAYLEQMKAEGRERDDGEPDEDYIADMDSDASDSDFKPGDSGSDVAEEYDSNPSTSDSSLSDASSSEVEEGELKRKKHRDSKPKRKVKTVSEKPRKKRKEKKEKDPNMPRRPSSAYMIWLTEHREEIKKSYPGISVTEVSKKAGEMWNKLEDKSEWQEKAAKLKEAYTRAMAEYKAKLKAEGGSFQKKTTPKKTKSSDSASSPTKKPSSAGSGGNYKSKEYISDSSSSGGDDDDDEDEDEEDAKSEASEGAVSNPASSEEEKEASGGSNLEEEEEEEDDDDE